MGIFADVISNRSLGTSTAKTQLSGDLSGNAAAWTVPTACKGLLWVAPELSVVTPTSAEATTASMTVESTDLGLPSFEVFASPVGNAVATNDSGLGSDNQFKATYPMMFDISDSVGKAMAGAQVSFYGIPQVSNTAAPYMGATIWWTDEAGLAVTLRGSGGPFKAKIGGAFGGAGSSTTTGTATGSVTGKTLTISSGVGSIRGVTGIVTPVTTVSAKPFSGYFIYSAPELAYTTRVRMEPSQGALGVNQQANHLTYVDKLNVPFATPTTINLNASFDLISSTAGNFMQGILYQ